MVLEGGRRATVEGGYYTDRTQRRAGIITEFGFENWKSYSRLPDRSDFGTDWNELEWEIQCPGRICFAEPRDIRGHSDLGALGRRCIAASTRGIEWAARKPHQVFAISVCRLSEQTDYGYRVECKLVYNHYGIESEKLVRRKYGQIRGGARTEAGKITLLSTEPCEAHSPTMIVRLRNGKRGTPRQVGRTQPVLVQVSAQKMLHEVQEGVTELLSSLRGICTRPYFFAHEG